MHYIPSCIWWAGNIGYDNTDTVNTHSRRDSYIKAGRKVLYLQDASEETADQTALVLLFFCPLCPFFIRIFIPFVGSTVHRFSNFLFFVIPFFNNTQLLFH